MTLTLDLITLHTIVHYSSISAYMPNFIEIEETSGGRMDISDGFKNRVAQKKRSFKLYQNVVRVSQTTVTLNVCYSRTLTKYCCTLLTELTVLSVNL